MKCSLDRNKTKAAIQAAVHQRVNNTPFLRRDENNVFATNHLAPIVLTDEQEKMIESAMQYKDQVKGYYSLIFETDPAGVLREIAHQANQTESEARTALAGVGIELFDIAVSLFPDAGLYKEAHDFIDSINKEFTGEVIRKVGPTQFVIDPAEDVITKYIAQESDSAAALIAQMRQNYIDQFEKHSVNLLTPDMWLNHPLLEDPTSQQLLAFAQKINPNFRVGFMDNLDQNAVAMIGDFIILLRSGTIVSELPEEVAHFFVELLPEDSQLRKDLIKGIVDFPIYKETLNLYKDNPAYQVDGKTNYDKIKREAAAKLISQYIKAAFNNTADAIYKGKRGWLRDLVHRIAKFLRMKFNRLSAPVYMESVISPYQDAAQQILSGDTSSLNLKKVPTVYDSLFFSAVEDAKPESWEASLMVKELYTFTTGMRKKLSEQFKKITTQKNMQGVSTLLEDAEYKGVSRLYRMTTELLESSKVLKGLMDTEEGNKMMEINAIVRVTNTLADVYRQMEMIPEAITKVVFDMKKNGTQAELVDNLTEMQAYFSLAENFRVITKDFINLLDYVENQNIPGMVDGGDIYNKMKATMGSSQTAFDTVDKKVLVMMRENMISMFHLWTKDAFAEYKKDIENSYGQAKYEEVRAKGTKYLEGKITKLEHIRQVFTGQFATQEEMMTADGKKIDNSRIRDMNGFDNLIVLFSSPTLVSDPIISNMMAYFFDSVVKGEVEGKRQSKTYADSLAPTIQELDTAGVNFYDANMAIQEVKEVYDASLTEGKTEKRVLLSETDRVGYNYQKQLKQVAIDNKRREIGRKHASLREGLMLPADRAGVINEIKDLNKQVEALVEDRNKFIEQYGISKYTPEYHALRAELEAKKGDSEVLKELKTLQKEIQLEEEKFYTSAILDAVHPDVSASSDVYSQKLAILYAKKADLRTKLPPVEEDTYAKLDQLYEIDQDQSNRVRANHKATWLAGVIQTTLADDTSTLTRQAIHDKYEPIYNAFFTINKPTQAFYDARTALFEELGKVMGTSDRETFLNKQQEDIYKEMTRITSSMRTFRKDVNVSAFKFSMYDAENLTSEILQGLEIKEDFVKSKRKIFSIIASSEEVHPLVKEQMYATTENAFAWAEVATNPSIPNAQYREIFGNLFTLTDSQINQIRAALEDARKGDDTALSNISSMTFSFKNEQAKNAQASIQHGMFSSIEKIIELEDALIQTFRLLKPRDIERREAIDDVWSEMNRLFSQNITQDYHIAMLDFAKYFKMYIHDDTYQTPSKANHKLVFEKTDFTQLIQQSRIESLFAGGVYEDTLSYIEEIAQRLDANNEDGADELYRFTRFFRSLHKPAVRQSGDEIFATYTLMRYARAPLANPEYMETTYPNFLNRNKVKDEFYTEQINELHPDVINGAKKATVDIKGEMLPKADPTSPFYNQKYADMRDSNDRVEQLKFKLLTEVTRQYLQKQVDYLTEEQRLDIILPAKYNDAYEAAKFAATRTSEWLKRVKDNIPFFNTKDTELEEEKVSTQEDLGVRTMENREIYSGRLINEKTAKLHSARRLAIEKTSKDAVSSVAQFIEEVNAFNAKNVVAPIFQSMVDVLRAANEVTPSANVRRLEIAQDLVDTKIYGITPKGFANNEQLAKILRIVTKFATARLLADPFGALVNLTTGQINNMIEQSWGKEGLVNYLSTTSKSMSWWAQYQRDSFNKSNWGKQTQLVQIFNMLPETLSLSRQLSTMAIAADVKALLMAPRTTGEQQMGIHLGLSLLEGNKPTIEGEEVSIDDLYELNSETNLVELKPEYSHLQEKWNPVDGTEVMKMRRLIMQKYTLIQGNFYKMNQSYISNFALGKAAETMKRWAFSGFVRRYAEETIDPFTGEARIGYHRAMFSLLSNIFGSIMKGQIDRIPDYWNSAVASRTSELGAIRRSLAEIASIAATAFVVGMIFGYSGDDKNKDLKNMGWWQQAAILIGVRVQGELGTFIPVPMFGLGYNEMKRMFLDPFGIITTSGVNNIFATVNLAVSQLAYWAGAEGLEKKLYYSKDQGYDSAFNTLIGFKGKGDSKLLAMILNTIGYTGYTADPEPYIKVIDNMQNRVK